MNSLDEWLKRQGDAYVAKLRAKKPRQPREAAPKKRATPERDAQDAIVALIRRHARKRVRVSHTRNQTTPPEAIRHNKDKLARFFARLKKGGVEFGHPDLTLRWAPGRVEYWETKAKRGSLSDAQKDWHADAREMGFEVRVVLDVTQAEARLRELGLLDSQQWGSMAALAGRVHP